MDFEILKIWWEISKEIAPGAVFVMGVFLFFLWRERLSDKSYTREAEKANLKILHELTNMLKNNDDKEKGNTQRIIDAIDNAKTLIISHINKN